MKPFAVAAVASLTVLLSACTSASHSPRAQRSSAPGPDRSSLIARADLDPCPASSGTASTVGLPNVTLPCLGAGPAVRLAALRGKPLVVNVWGSWCGPCQRETPYLSQVYDQLHGRVRFLGVDDEDDPDSALDFAAHVQPPMRYPSVSDENKQVLLGLHGPVAVPMTLFVDATGRLRHVSIKAYGSTNELLADIDHYLGVRG